jgi:hypothetical protein
MSGYDLGVWCTDVAITPTFAAEYYRLVGSNWLNVETTPEFKAFFGELLARYPNLGGNGNELQQADEVPDWLLRTIDGDDETAPVPAGPAYADDMDFDNSAWASTVVPFGCMVPLSVSWERVTEVVPEVQGLALKHGLVVYDPQENTVMLPTRLSGKPSTEPRPLMVLALAGKRPAVSARISLHGRTIASETLPSRRVAHTKAKALAKQNHLSLYEVQDPFSVAQEQPDRVDANDPGLPDQVKRLVAQARRDDPKAVSVVRYRSGTFKVAWTRASGEHVQVSVRP